MIFQALTTWPEQTNNCGGDTSERVFGRFQKRGSLRG